MTWHQRSKIGDEISKPCCRENIKSEEGNDVTKRAHHQASGNAPLVFAAPPLTAW